MEKGMIERTLAIIKPDAMGNRVAGKIIDRIEREGFNILGVKLLHLSTERAKAFYAVHQSKPFFDELIEYMTSGKIIVMTLECENAVSHWRSVMGATDPAKAEAGTIRKLFGSSITQNACHGSDSLENAETEVRFFFQEEDLVR
jgi:nucleoside-diphosphate kinase